MTNIELLAKLINQERVANKGTLHDAPVKTERFGKHYSVLIGIGKDHTAEITLTDDALEALDSIVNEPSHFNRVSTQYTEEMYRQDVIRRHVDRVGDVVEGAEKVDVKGHG